jgi:lipoteichoic acid synthase
LDCKPGRDQHLNVILVITESLSAYQSQFFSGVENWTPRVDEIARHGTTLANFYANGWSTDGGLVALLTGTIPLVPELRRGRTETFAPVGGMSLSEYLDLPGPLPRVLSTEDGYFTDFVAPGDITFFGQDKFLANIGFERVVEGNDPRYATQKLRGPFNSVPDRLLFQVALDEVMRMPRDRPYFLVAQTFWSHPPFMDSNDRGHLNGPEPVFRDTDAQIGAFYDGLMKQGFFEHGLMFITGDHRAMVPYQKGEVEHFGASAPARIPGVIVTNAIALPRNLTQDFQQRDFPASIEALVGKQYCLAPQQGSFLSAPPTPPRCVIQARGDDRDMVYVKCGSAEGIVMATGDNTRFVSGTVPDEAAIIETINRTRVRARIR